MQSEASGKDNNKTEFAGAKPTVSSLRGAGFERRGPIGSLVVAGMILIVAIVVGTAVMIDSFRQRAIDNAKRELENTVLLLSRHFDQQMRDWQIIQNDLVAYAETLDTSSPEEFKRVMGSSVIHQSLATKIGATPYVGVVNVFGADGSLINSSGMWPVPKIHVTDRAYFKIFSSDASSPKFLVQPLHSRITGRWTTNLLRKITGPHGEFLGVITRGIEPATFETFFASLSLGKNSAVSVFYEDGTLLARYPHMERHIGHNFGTGPLFRTIIPHADHGAMRLISPVDGKDRIGAIRRLQNYPLLVVATLTVPEALADWAQQTKFLLLIACLLSTIIAALLYLIVRRLSAHHRTQQKQLTVEKQRLDTAINNMKPGLLLFDADQRLVIHNGRYAEMFGLPADSLHPGRDFRDLIALRKNIGSFKGDVEEYCDLVMRGSEAGLCFVNETPDNRVIQVTIQPVADGGWVSTHEDITERRRSDERIAYLAKFDALTALPNRTSFRDRLEQMLARLDEGAQLAILYIDIDQFKSVNDTLGHHVGDELLKSVASRLSNCVDSPSFVARLGGDEFAIVQTGMRSPEQINNLIARIYEMLRMPSDCLGHQLTSDASIGVAVAPKDGLDLDQLVKNADLAMYAAKGGGRRTHRFFEADMEIQAQRRRELEGDLSRGLLEGSFEIHYQPILDVRSREISGCEALVRWNHPERGMISPAEFIPIAEEAGLIDQLGLWVLSSACQEAVKWPDHVKVAVNVSPLQFKQSTFALKTASILAASGLAPTRLELEITEAVLIRDDDEALAILHHLRALGVRIGLDDFGTGYSSLSYLQRFPLDKIKIDRSFVENIEHDDFSSSIVRAIVDIAAARNMTTTAEGVETQDQLDHLCTLGCDQIQGYLFSRPIPAAQLMERFFSRSIEVAADANATRRL
ncbi:MAG: EAL domain-containing protein [Xanthobacteraceae bacterium]|nr:EAL domain-containing protein [Xanthobacteraceae bacterium]